MTEGVQLSMPLWLDSVALGTVKLQGVGGNRFPPTLDVRKECRKHGRFCGECADESNHGRAGASNRTEVIPNKFQTKSEKITEWRKKKAKEAEYSRRYLGAE